MTNFTDMLSKAKDLQDKMREAQEKIKKIDAQFNINFDAVYVCKYFAHRFTYNHK